MSLCSGFPDGNDLDRTKIRRIPRTVVHIGRRIALGNIPVKPELFNYLAERIIGILFKKARAGIPAGSATDAARTIDNNYHGHSKFYWGKGQWCPHPVFSSCFSPCPATVVTDCQRWWEYTTQPMNAAMYSRPAATSFTSYFFFAIT